MGLETLQKTGTVDNYGTAPKKLKLSSRDCRSLTRELQRSPTKNVKELAASGRYEVAPITSRRTVKKHNYGWKNESETSVNK